MPNSTLSSNGSRKKPPQLRTVTDGFISNIVETQQPQTLNPKHSYASSQPGESDTRSFYDLRPTRIALLIAASCLSYLGVSVEYQRPVERLDQGVGGNVLEYYMGIRIIKDSVVSLCSC